jgi:cobalt-zinc-cadmium resistance protein CzcA
MKIKQKLDSQLDLPAGYNITYGGAFETCKGQKSPGYCFSIALALIFLLLFFALHSFPQT